MNQLPATGNRFSVFSLSDSGSRTIRESAGGQTKQLLKLLEEFPAVEVEAAVREAIAGRTPRASSVGFILYRRRRSGSRQIRPVDLSRHPHLQYLAVPTLEIYDELTDDDE
jgi:hypothetical protein